MVPKTGCTKQDDMRIIIKRWIWHALRKDTTSITRVSVKSEKWRWSSPRGGGGLLPKGIVFDHTYRCEIGFVKDLKTHLKTPEDF